MLRHCDSIIEALAGPGYIIIEDCFAPKLIENLIQECDTYASRGQMQTAKIGQGAKIAPQTQIRGDQIAWLEQNKLSAAQTRYLQAMETLRLALNRHLYLGLFDYEAHFACYPPGSFYQKHRDQFRNNTLRQVSTICYLNKDWEANWGGQLKLYHPEQPEQMIAEVYPKANTFVCFLSERFPHEVGVTEKMRLSLTGWFRRRS